MKDIWHNEVESDSVEDIGPDDRDSTMPKVAEKEVIIIIVDLVQEPEY